jgi:hypothetical protein
MVDLSKISREVERMGRAKAIVKVIKLTGWHWQGVIPSFNIDEAVEDAKRLAPFQYPSAKQIFVIPIFFN